MSEFPQSPLDSEASGSVWKRRTPQPADNHLLARTQNWLNAMPRGVRPVHLHEEFPRIANDISRLWGETAALDHYYQDLDFSPRMARTGFRPVIKEELLAMHLFSLRNRTGPYEDRVPKQASLLSSLLALCRSHPRSLRRDGGSNSIDYCSWVPSITGSPVKVGHVAA